jgi:hypothetical protein
VLVVFTAITSMARAAEERPSVIILQAKPADATPWPEGTRALIAELFTSGYELAGRDSSASSLVEVARELELVSSEPGFVGAVAVFRQDKLGLALVHTSRRGFVRVEADVSQGTVAESRLALRVVELLRDVDIPTLPRPEPTQSAVSPPPPPRPPPASEQHQPAWQVWLAGGAIFSSNLARPLPWVGFSGAFAVSPHVSLEATLGASVLAGRADTSAGEVELQSQQAALYLMFAPFAERAVGVELGLGGGVVLLQASASANPGFRAVEDSSAVGLATSRACAFVASGRARFILTLEPGLLIPPVAVEVDSAETLRIGRPWFTATLGVGPSL